MWKQSLGDMDNDQFVESSRQNLQTENIHIYQRVIKEIRIHTKNK